MVSSLTTGVAGSFQTAMPATFLSAFCWSLSPAENLGSGLTGPNPYVDIGALETKNLTPVPLAGKAAFRAF